MTYLLLIVSAGLNAVASLFLKFLTTGGAPLIAFETLRNPYLYAAVACFGLNIVGYALFLQRVNLAVGYPVYVGTTFALVLGLSFLVLRETIAPVQIFGIVLIFGGIALAVR